MKTLSSILLISVFCAACANSTYLITSNPPDANVDVVYANGSKKSLGKTPVNTNSSQANPAKDAFTVEITKENFEKTSVYVPTSAINKDVAINAVLVPSVQPLEVKRTDVQINGVAAGVADVQRDIQSKNYDMALTKLNRLIAENPGVSTFYSLSGNVHYLEKRLDKALGSYKRALELDPKSADLAKIVDKLEGMKGTTR